MARWIMKPSMIQRLVNSTKLVVLIIFCLCLSNMCIQVPLVSDLLFAAYCSSTDPDHLPKVTSLLLSLFQPHGSSPVVDLLRDIAAPTTDTVSSDLPPAAPLKIDHINQYLRYVMRMTDSYPEQCALGFLPDQLLAGLPPTVLPDDETFALMVRHWRKTNSFSMNSAYDNNMDIANKAQRLFDAMFIGDKQGPLHVSSEFTINPSLQAPSLATFSLLIDLWSRVDAPRSVDILLYTIQHDAIPTASSFAVVMSSLIAEGSVDVAEQIFYLYLATIPASSSSSSAVPSLPESTCCNLIMNAFFSSKPSIAFRGDIGERTMAVMDQIQKSGKRWSPQWVMQSLMAWSRSKSPLAASKAEETLRQALQSGVELSHQHYNKLLDICSKRDTRNSTRKSEEIVQLMKDNGLQPNLVTYNSVLSQWGKSSDPLAEERAFSVFDQIIEADLQPDLITFTSLLSTISRSRDPQAPLRAMDVFEQMRENDLPIDVTAYTILISVWSRSWLKERETQVQRIYESMRENNIRPNAVTYTTLLTFWSESSHPQAKMQVVKIFKEMTDLSVALDLVGYRYLNPFQLLSTHPFRITIKFIALFVARCYRPSAAAKTTTPPIARTRCSIR